MSLQELSRQACFGGTQVFCTHQSSSTATPMRFSVFLPPGGQSVRPAMVTALAGLTCTEETFATKAGAQRTAARLGLSLLFPDTSPRGVELPGDRDHWDFGVGAGFYLDATAQPWSQHYRMFTYVTAELPALVAAHFGLDAGRQGILGHSMGGHGALVAGLRMPERYASVSAFAPVAAPIRCPWGQKAFAGYLGPHADTWRLWDATALVEMGHRTGEILVDQGSADKFLETQLLPGHFEAACAEAGQPLRMRHRDGYDHSYYFISTFVEEHLEFHARRLG
jgi:S-formylglutathione hydrolase